MDVDSDDDDFDVSSNDEDEDDLNPKAKLKKRRMVLLKQHLELLAQSSIKFVRLESTKGAGEWSVNFRELMNYMKQLELEKIVEERFGIKAIRLLRICDEKGKLEEKQVYPLPPSQSKWNANKIPARQHSPINAQRDPL